MTEFNQPLSGNDMPRFGGIASMFRLPVQSDASGLDVALVGVPLDIGTSNRTGSRYGPRQIRSESVLVRPYGMATRAAPEDFDWARERGVRVVPAEECWYKSLAPLMGEIRESIGPDRPVYLSFDIDGLDPSVAPGTGTPEPGGLSTSQGLEIIRGMYGLNLIGCDLVEVSPSYDTSGNTALLAANLVFEMLCSLPGCQRRG